MHPRGPHDTPQSQVSIALVVLLTLWAWLNAGAAAAEAAARPVPGAVVLGFGETYRGAGGTRTHQGADMAGTPGQEVLAPIEGVVTFAGQVPAVDATGSTVGCVTVASGQDRWSLLPLSAMTVREGEALGAGDPVGSLAGAGDGSTQAPHVHVGLRRGGRYVDPVGELGAAPPVTTPGAGGAGASEEEEPGSSGPGAPGQTAPEEMPAPAEGQQGVPATSEQAAGREPARPAESAPAGGGLGVRTGARSWEGAMGRAAGARSTAGWRHGLARGVNAVAGTGLAHARQGSAARESALPRCRAASARYAARDHGPVTIDEIQTDPLTRLGYLWMCFASGWALSPTRVVTAAKVLAGSLVAAVTSLLARRVAEDGATAGLAPVRSGPGR